MWTGSSASRPYGSSYAPGQLFTECQGIWACRSADSVCEGPPCIGTDWTCCAEKDCTGIGTLGCACDQSGNNCVPVCT